MGHQASHDSSHRGRHGRCENNVHIQPSADRSAVEVSAGEIRTNVSDGRIFRPITQQTSLMVERRVVDNRVFLLGLDGLYRPAMKRHERTELLICARQVAAALQVSPANVPVEGYYSEEPELSEYFRIMRALQEVEGRRIPEVARMKEFKRLQDVTSAPLYGRPVDSGKLLPAGRSALSQALLETFPEWTVARLIGAAYEIALKTDDISLVGLAARIRDPVVLAALGESAVLYMDYVFGIAQTPEYVWEVDSDLLELANRFIDAFNTLF